VAVSPGCTHAHDTLGGSDRLFSPGSPAGSLARERQGAEDGDLLPVAGYVALVLGVVLVAIGAATDR
jgi:hypothetical protein